MNMRHAPPILRNHVHIIMEPCPASSCQHRWLFSPFCSFPAGPKVCIYHDYAYFYEFWDINFYGEFCLKVIWFTSGWSSLLIRTHVRMESTSSWGLLPVGAHFWLRLKLEVGPNWKKVWPKTGIGPKLEVGPNWESGSKNSTKNATKHPVA